MIQKTEFHLKNLVDDKLLNFLKVFKKKNGTILKQGSPHGPIVILCEFLVKFVTDE